MAEVVWKFMYRRQKGKNAKLKVELKNYNGELKDTRKELKRVKRKNTELKRAIAEMQEGYVNEYCDHCGYEQSFFWNIETMGREAFCPYCGQMLHVGTSDGEDENEATMSRVKKDRAIIAREVANEYR